MTTSTANCAQCLRLKGRVSILEEQKEKKVLRCEVCSSAADALCSMLMFAHEPENCQEEECIVCEAIRVYVDLGEYDEEDEKKT